MTVLKVQAKACDTCIYRKDSPLDLGYLESQVRDPHGCGFKGARICHHSKDAICRGFWNRHKDEFSGGQIAQRLQAMTGHKLIEFVHHDTLKEKPCANKKKSKG